MKKKFGPRLLLVLFSLLLGLVGVEALARLWLPPVPLVTYPHPKYLTALRPGEWRIKFPGELPVTDISINPLGFRGHRSVIDERRHLGAGIAVLGDSFTFGYGVDDDQTWPRELEKCLRLRTGSDVTLFNLGVPGTAADQHYLRLRELSATLAPLVVIEEIYLPHLNTLMDHEWIESREGDLVGLRLRTGLSVVDSSQVHDLMMKAYRVTRDSLLSVRAFIDALRTLRARAIPEAWIYLNPDEYDEAQARAWRNLFKALLLLKEYTEKIRAQFFVVVIPQDLQVSEAEWQPLYRANKLLRQRREQILLKDYPQSTIAEFLRDQDINFFDALPSFRQNYRPDMYFKTDVHLTPSGSRYFGDLVCGYLIEQRVLAR